MASSTAWHNNASVGVCVGEVPMDSLCSCHGIYGSPSSLPSMCKSHLPFCVRCGFMQWLTVRLFQSRMPPLLRTRTPLAHLRKDNKAPSPHTRASSGTRRKATLEPGPAQTACLPDRPNNASVGVSVLLKKYSELTLLLTVTFTICVC